MAESVGGSGLGSDAWYYIYGQREDLIAGLMVLPVSHSALPREGSRSWEQQLRRNSESRLLICLICCGHEAL